MKTFEQICDEVANDCFYEKWMFMPWSTQSGLFKQVAYMYARQCCEDVLNRAAENAEVDYTNNDGGGYVRNYHVDKESITSTEIILL